MNTVKAGSTPHPISSYQTHAHFDWEIILTTSGDNCSLIGNEEYHIGAGDILVIPPNTPHGSKPGGELFTDIYVSARYLPFDGFVMTHDYDDSLSRLMPLIMKETMKSPHDSDGELCDCMLDVICRYITKYRGTSCKHRFVADFRNIIFDNMANSDFDISAEVKRLGFSTDYFRRCFCAECGITPGKYLTNLRIGESKKLLSDSRLSISEIARQCGFSDVYYFSRRFKSEVGVTPREFRRHSDV